MRGVVWLVVLSVCTLQVQAAVMETITQTTAGWCSPAVGQAGGNVTIICQGVDPKALARLNELLDKKDLELQAKIREAEEWTQKYRELEQRLATQGQEEPLTQVAQVLLKEGKLDEAGIILDRLLETGEKGVEQTAAHHFNRAEVYALQFQRYRALPHYEKAYQYRPDNVQYAFRYAVTLQHQHHYTRSQMAYQEALTTYRQLAQANPQAYLPNVATTLNNLGNLYSDTQRLTKGEQAYQEALATYRQLAQANPQAYLPNVAMILNNLGLLYRATQRLTEGEQAYQEALTIRRQLAQANPQAYLPNVAMTLNNLGLLYHATQRLTKGEQVYQEALTTYRQLAQANPQAYLPNVATILNNLGLLYHDTQRLTEGEQVYQEALTTYRQLAQANPQAYLPNVATILNNLGLLYRDTQRLTEGEQVYQEALTIRRQLAQANPQAYLPDVAMTLNNLGLLELSQNKVYQAQTLIAEALTIRRALWKIHRTVYGDALAGSLRVEILILQQQKATGLLICERLTEMASVALQEGLKRWAEERTVTICQSNR